MIWIVLPAISAFIGWLTNKVAVKMLFHPKKPVRLWPFTLQGVFPKRQKALAVKLGQVVSDELFSVSDIEQHLKEKANSPVIHQAIHTQIENFLTHKLPEAVPMAAMFLNPTLIAKIREPLFNSLQEGIQGLLTTFHEELEKDLDVHQIVTTKVENFSSDKLEEILLAIMKKEFTFIEWIGGLLGFVIGLIQVTLITIFSGTLL